jgi:hypothetical protein
MFVQRRRRSEGAWVWCCTALAALAFILSFGTRVQLGDVRPYEWLVQRAIPGFAQLRSPYRFAAMMELFLLVPAGVGLAALLRMPRRSLRLAAGCTLCLLVLEPVAWPQPLRRVPLEAVRTSWVAWLRARPGGSVAMIPPEASGRVEDYEPVALAMLQSLAHGHPLAGGYSGFFPAAADRLSHLLRSFPSREAVSALMHAGVRYAVVDRAWAVRTLQGAPHADASAMLRLAHVSSAALVYEVLDTSASPAPPP